MSNLISTLRGVVNRVEEKADDLDLVVGNVAAFAGSAVVVGKALLRNADARLAEFDSEGKQNNPFEDDLKFARRAPVGARNRYHRMLKAADARFGRDGHYWRTMDFTNQEALHGLSEHYNDFMAGRNGWEGYEDIRTTVYPPVPRGR